MLQSTEGLLEATEGVWKAIMRITGPNDVRHVVWALGEFFIISFVY